MGGGAIGRAAERVVEDRVVPAGEPWARVLTTGQTLRIVDLEGRQAVDFLCYSAANPEERYNAADTMKYAKTIFLTRGHGIYSDCGRRLFTIVEDTCGRHDTIGGCCSAESNELRYGVTGTFMNQLILATMSFLPSPNGARAARKFWRQLGVSATA